jgi:hypothetical protein
MRVHLNDGIQIIGWPKFWRSREVFITDAEVFDREGRSLGEVKSPGGLLITDLKATGLDYLIPAILYGTRRCTRELLRI